ncbi:Trihelix transcription factor ENAP2 [Linum perenne]
MVIVISPETPLQHLRHRRHSFLLHTALPRHRLNNLLFSLSQNQRSWRKSEEDVAAAVSVRRLARAIERFGEVYERVESDKLRQMVDLEKQRMKFAKDLEMERMSIFTETQIELEKIKKGKRSGSNGLSI